MRVITGSARGRRLITLSGEDRVRPTTDRVKEGLFSAIQFDVEGRRFLDLFAGSGQLGIEALSRGAESCCFVDSSADAVAVVKQNLAATGLAQKAKVIHSDFTSFAALCKDTFDVALIDPPYDAGLFEKALQTAAGLMSAYGILWCEHPESTVLPEQISGFVKIRHYRYGSIGADLYRREEKD